MTKLAIVEDREEDKYEHLTLLKHWPSDPVQGLSLPELNTAAGDPLIKSLVDGVLNSMSSARQSEVKAWEEEIMACEHTLTLEQLATGAIQGSGFAHCNKCGLKENLWLCLTCGSLGCGRKQFGGIGGNGHGLTHFEESGHPVSVKLGTITPEGSADIYCYICNDSKLDSELALHLSTFGINVQTQTKTEKSMTELQIEHNLKFDFSLTDESGKALEPVFGPGLTGLANLGNSCYMASVLQAIFSLPSFQARYLPTAPEHWITCTTPLPADCIDCQMHKIADGLLSGRYSHPRATPSPSAQDPKSTNPLAHDSPTPVFQEGIKPTMFKALVGKGHEEFATMRQQDSEEFLGHLVTTLRRHAKKVGTPGPEEVFAFGMEQKLECGRCGGVRYRVDQQDVLSLAVPAREKGKDEEGRIKYEDVKVEECLDGVFGVEGLEYRCPKCDASVEARKQVGMKTFPNTLVVHAKKFQLVNWVPTKLDIPLIMPADDTLILDKYLSKGLQPGETELPGDAPAPAAAPSFNEAAMAQLEAMGFPQVRCQKALLATGNSDPEAAMNWLFAHMEDPDIDAPIDFGAASAGGAASSSSLKPSAEQVSMLADMGFSSAQAKKALRETGGDPERAVEWLFSHPDDTGLDDPAPAAPTATEATTPSIGGTATLPAKYILKAFISHKGPSVHSGHYVAHIKKEGEGWVLFNDEKVVKADEESVRELKALAYLYVFERV